MLNYEEERNIITTTIGNSEHLHNTSMLKHFKNIKTFNIHNTFTKVFYFYHYFTDVETEAQKIKSYHS